MGNLGLVNFSLWCVLIACTLIGNTVKSEDSCEIDVADALSKLLDKGDSIQMQALRRRLLDIIRYRGLTRDDLRNSDASTENEWEHFRDQEKRNLESLARAGIWYKNPPELDQNDDANYKRSMANLAKNDPLFLIAQSLDTQKRGIGSLVRNGDFRRRQNYQLTGNQELKRNLASIARNYNFPAGITTELDKRSIANLAKNGDFPYAYGKRNIQSLARDGKLGKRSTEYLDAVVDKRNIQSIKANKQRNKREADYFENEMVHQMPPDYEDILQELAASQEYYPVEDKRFLGRLPQMGKPKTTAIPKARRYH